MFKHRAILLQNSSKALGTFAVRHCCFRIFLLIIRSFVYVHTKKSHIFKSQDLFSKIFKRFSSHLQSVTSSCWKYPVSNSSSSISFYERNEYFIGISCSCKCAFKKNQDSSVFFNIFQAKYQVFGDAMALQQKMGIFQ